MITILSCRATAARQLAHAVTNPQRRASLTASADRWILLAGQIAEMDAASINFNACVIDAAMRSDNNHRSNVHTVTPASKKADARLIFRPR